MVYTIRIRFNKRPKNLSVIRIHAVRYPSNFPFRKVLDCSYVKGPLKRIGTVLNRASFLKDGSFKLWYISEKLSRWHLTCATGMTKAWNYVLLLPNILLLLIWDTASQAFLVLFKVYAPNSWWSHLVTICVGAVEYMFLITNVQIQHYKITSGYSIHEMCMWV